MILLKLKEKKKEIFNLAQIHSKPYWNDLIHDPAHRNVVDIKSIKEALVGITAEKYGFLPNPIRRDPTGAAEFIDRLGRAWDVKAAVSRTPKGIKIFNAERLVNSVKKSLGEKENVILDLTLLEKEDFSPLIREVSTKLSHIERRDIIVVMEKDGKNMIAKKLEEILSHE